jgi:hypothetical protein
MKGTGEMSGRAGSVSPYLKLSHSPGVLRIGVLLDSNALEAADSQLLADLFASEHISVAAVAVGRRANSALAGSVTFLGRCLMRAYAVADRKLYGGDPTGTADLATYLGPVRSEVVISGADSALAAELGGRDLDVILCSRPFSGMSKFAACARFGTWWVAATAEPTADAEYLHDLYVTAAGDGPLCAVLWALTAGDSAAVPIAFGTARPAWAISVLRNRQSLYPIRRNLWLAGLRTLLLRGWEQQRLGSAAIQAVLDYEPAKVRSPSDVGVVAVASALTRMGGRFVRRRRRYRNRVEQWQVGVRTRSGDDDRLLDTDGYQWLAAPRGHWYADPFLFSAAGAEYLFMEDFNEQSGLGCLVCGRINAGGAVGELRVVLQKSYHLSYPHVFEHADEIYMIPETGTNNTVELYRAVSFPWEWEFLKVLYQGRAFDTTALYHESRFWFFTTLVEDAEWNSNQLLLFHSERVDGDWTLHPANPISNDARFARNAGNILRLGGNLVRTAQDGHQVYGGAVRFHRMNVLTMDQYSESEIGVMTPAKFANGLGVHTYNRSDSMEVIDRRVLISTEVSDGSVLIPKLQYVARIGASPNQ